MKDAACNCQQQSCALIWDIIVTCVGYSVGFHVTYCVPGVLTVFMSGCYALYPSSSEVVDLNPANFDQNDTKL